MADAVAAGVEADASLQAPAEIPDGLPEVEPEAIASLRSALRGDLSTRGVADAVRDLLLEGLSASKSVYASCPACGKRHAVSLPDLATRIASTRAIVEEIEGRAAQAKSVGDTTAETLAAKTRSELESLSDDELLVLAVDPGTPDLREGVLDAARRVLAAHPFAVPEKVNR